MNEALATFCGLLIMVLVIFLLIWVAHEFQEEDCARQWDVYECEWVLQPRVSE